MKMEQTECSETSAYKIQTPGNYPEESIQILLDFVEHPFYFRRKFHNRDIVKFFTGCKHFLSKTILYLTLSFPENVVISDVSGAICITKLFAAFRNVKTPVCKLPSELAVMT
jgi:hypothetical protein